MLSSRLSIVLSFRPAFGSEFMAEVINFAEYVHPRDKSISTFIADHVGLVSSLAKKYHVDIEIATEEGDAEVQVLELEENVDFEDLIDDLTEALFKEAEDKGFVLIRAGTINQEVRIEQEVPNDVRSMN